jgi:N6-L-threonylcarbamoyladenine synthase
MVILGIETSCDETAIALIEIRTINGFFECRIIQSLIHSQAELHSAYGGVYPNLAKREHQKNLVPLLKKILSDFENKDTIAEETFKEKIGAFHAEFAPKNSELFKSVSSADFLKNIPKIDAIAVTEGPGLEPALWVGINFARILGNLWQIPIMPIDHMEGHIVGSLLETKAPYGTWQKLKDLPLPTIAFLLSGGHTELVKVNSIGNYEILGQTLDDAVGEAFDKVARLLGLSYPGGPHISLLANQAREEKIPLPVKLPRPMINSGNLNLSFSGLKTAVLYAVKKAQESDQFTENYRKGLAYEFEQSVAETLDSKLRSAIIQCEAKSIIVGGGVSANNILRQTFKKTANEFNIPIFLPERHISGDNALMIALVGALHGIKEERILRAEGTKRLFSTRKDPTFL